MSPNSFWEGILGINARNARIARVNDPKAIRLVDDKYTTKQTLARVGVPVAPTLRLVRSRRELAGFDWNELPETWALKPNQSAGGHGIMLAAGRGSDGGWQTAGGKPLPEALVADHVRLVLEGEFSKRNFDLALFEPLLRPHEHLAYLCNSGLPDVRVICRESQPLLAMLRLPTSASAGRANLHQGAIGAAIDITTGEITQASVGRTVIERHPDTGELLPGVIVPAWDVIVDAARKCGGATNLHYSGTDIVVDETLGPVVLEVNARPGLQIQNVTGRGLVELLEREGT